ncbi:lipid-A-disaccharide synthase [Haematospirillum sp. H1815]|uniref:lipid-A-disaccharide synthase n=1 Tax=Haematospirillum sp. H1815 TaxID=2723108 RepID=UPI00143B4309|nr:lipid-A-disaccharide synthase [Haematospirillum sp. H1815]NKD76344.1 lipid-A-disaccharide synthase [Haematospirillum sp. H1815]
MTSDIPLFFIVTGEPSGDVLGARLMAALKRATGGRIRFMGVGGESMAAEGLESLVDQSALAVMGLVEVIPRIPRVLAIIRSLTDRIVQESPVALITVDSWGFTGRLQRSVAKASPSVRRIHYVAPMVWAWKETRAKTVARTVQSLLCLLPNEPAWFRPYGLECCHVGHPVVGSGADKGDGALFRAQHNIAPDSLVLCVLPGSRHSETSRLLPVLKGVVTSLVAMNPDLVVVVPTVATVSAMVAEAVKSWPARVVLVRGEQDRYAAFAASTAAVAASGTVTLELAMASVPHCIIYRVAPLTAWIFRRLTRLRFVNLINIVRDREIVPELLQEKCVSERIAPVVQALLYDPSQREAQRLEFAQSLRYLAGGDGDPADRAAAAVLEFSGVRQPVP